MINQSLEINYDQNLDFIRWQRLALIELRLDSERQRESEREGERPQASRVPGLKLCVLALPVKQVPST